MNINVHPFIYQYKDHLGNVRLSYADTNGNGIILASEIIEESNYYPFGMRHEGYNIALLSTNIGQKIKYQGQERQDELGLGWNSFKWRNYDYAIGRFFNIDPLAEKYPHWAPYVFSGNRVIDARELEGLEPYTLFSTEEKASENFLMLNQPHSINNKVEIATKIYTTTDTDGNPAFAYVTPLVGSPKGFDNRKIEAVPEGTTATAFSHSHAEFSQKTEDAVKGGNDKFSGRAGDKNSQGDMGLAERKNLNMYVGTPNGSHFKYDVNTNEITLLGTNLPSDRKHPDRLNQVNPVAPALNLTPMPIKEQKIEAKLIPIP